MEAWELSLQPRRQDPAPHLWQRRVMRAHRQTFVHKLNTHRARGGGDGAVDRAVGSCCPCVRSVPTRPQALGHQAENALCCVLSVPSLPHPTPHSHPGPHREKRRERAVPGSDDHRHTPSQDMFLGIPWVGKQSMFYALPSRGISPGLGEPSPLLPHPGSQPVGPAPGAPGDYLSQAEA